MKQTNLRIYGLPASVIHALADTHPGAKDLSNLIKCSVSMDRVRQVERQLKVDNAMKFLKQTEGK